MTVKRSVVVLGASGSGKTVFLASMASKLSVQSREIGFFLSVPLEERKLLAQKYEQVAYDREWPAGTREVSDWNFVCNVFAMNSMTFPTFEFTYIDYAGGILTDVEDDVKRARELEKKAGSADVLMGIIDGHKLYSELDERVASPLGTRLYRDLDSYIPLMAEHGSKPIHFLISKWDLLHEKHSLKEVHDFLMQLPGFSNLVQGRGDRGTPIRLIPVSSVGMNFARLQDGIMEKIPNAVPSPWNVEIPISHVVLDEMTTHVDVLEELREKLKDEGKSDGIPDGMRRILQALQGLVPGKYKWSVPILNEIVDFLLDVAEEEISEIRRRKRDEALRKVRDEQTAIESCMKSFMFIVSRFDEDFPESDLSKP